MSKFPRITFGIIVLNGEPFTRYCLRALYPFAHEIIVVEGAARNAAAIATPDGHSTDDTLEVLRKFKAEEDPEDKVQIVVQNGFWSEKDEQSQAYAEKATGDYLWQVDIDEFYKPVDMQIIMEMLRNNREITTVSFKQITFWGGFDYLTDGWYLQWGAGVYHRLFKWGSGYRYVAHRPPTVYDPLGINLRTLKWINGSQLAQQGIFLYHYSFVFPKQVQDKCKYYSQADWAGHAIGAVEWAYNNFFTLKDPFRVHNVYQYPSWLERFEGQHPPEIIRLQNDIHDGRISVELRQIDDVEQILRSHSYLMKRAALKKLSPIGRQFQSLRSLGARIKQRIGQIGGKIEHPSG
jgi:glycosyltransferase involved in cell wall biosynthesis